MFQLKECIFWTKVAYGISTFWTFYCLSEVAQIPHVIFENRVSFCVNLAPFCISQLKHKCKAKLKGAHLRVLKREQKGRGFTPIPGVLFPVHIRNDLSVCLFLEFESQLGKSEEFNNQRMKENEPLEFFLLTKNKKVGKVCLEFS